MSARRDDNGKDPVARAARAARQERRLPKRFYERVEIAEDALGYEILLDDRPVRAPSRRALRLPSRQLAEAVAGEWQAQGEHVDPGAMPMTRLANTAIDRVSPRVDEVVADVIEYAGSDMTCYRADHPDALVARQAQHWDPIIADIERQIGARFILVQGVMHATQPAETLARFRNVVAAFGSFALTGVHNLTTLSGSALLAVAVARGLIGAEAAWAAAHVDEDWQIEQWGRDEEAAARRAARHADFQSSARFIDLLDSTGS